MYLKLVPKDNLILLFYHSKFKPSSNINIIKNVIKKL